MNISNVKFDTGPPTNHQLPVLCIALTNIAIGVTGPPHPEISILPPLPALQEHDGMASPHLGDLVDRRSESAARVVLAHVQLGFLLGMGGERHEVFEEVAVARRDATGGDEEEALLVVVASVGFDG